MKWTDRLDKADYATVKGFELERSEAVMDWMNGKISMTEARQIVAKCNREIEKIAGCCA